MAHGKNPHDLLINMLATWVFNQLTVLVQFPEFVFISDKDKALVNVEFVGYVGSQIMI